MRTWLLLLAALTMQACISVEDFGESWAKGTVDPSLEGRWTKIGLAGVPVASVPGPQTMIFTRAGDGYDVTDGRDHSPAEPTLAARTLHAGSGRLLMFRGAAPVQDRPAPAIQGVLIRYELKDDLYREFSPQWNRIEALLESKYSSASSMKLNNGVLVVKRFDEDTYRLLSEIAGDSSYWSLSCEYRKQP